MFAVSARHTMANAKPKFRAAEVIENERLELARLRKAEEEAYARLEAERKRVNASIKAANDALARVLAEDEVPRFRHSYRLIEKRLCRVFGISAAELHSIRRDRRLVVVRKAVGYWAYRLTIRSLPDIGRLMGDRDHTTVLHYVREYPKVRAKMGRHLRPAR